MKCGCGCGQDVPIHAGNRWVHHVPYWAWICWNNSCEWYGAEWRNQSGDSACSMCGRRRELIGHFQSGERNKCRITVSGQKVYAKTVAGMLFAGRGMLDGNWDALRNTPIGDD